MTTRPAGGRGLQYHRATDLTLTRKKFGAASGTIRLWVSRTE